MPNDIVRFLRLTHFCICLVEHNLQFLSIDSHYLRRTLRYSPYSLHESKIICSTIYNGWYFSFFYNYLFKHSTKLRIYTRETYSESHWRNLSDCKMLVHIAYTEHCANRFIYVYNWRVVLWIYLIVTLYILSCVCCLITVLMESKECTMLFVLSWNLRFSHFPIAVT